MDIEDDSTPPSPEAIPVIEEELVTGTREVKTGSVRVRKEVERIRKEVAMPLVRDAIKITRVPVNRVIASAPRMREEGDTLIVPVIEEQIVVEKRLVLKEEIHILRKRVEERVTKTVTLGREHATVERLDGEGNIVATSKPRESPAEAPLPVKRKSLLD